MTEVHSIWLHGPWQASLQRVDSKPFVNDVPEQMRLHIPGNWDGWLGSSFRGLVHMQRDFGLPTNLVEQQKIGLVIEEIDFRASIWLNGQNLGQHQLGDSPFRCDIRPLLQARNRLRLEIELPTDAERGERNSMSGGLIGEVRLEISG